jgi:pseudaminic acid synthase
MISKYPGKTFIIAEISANHNNDFNLTVKTIEAIADSGANAVKIQTYQPESLSIDVDNDFFGPIQHGLWKGMRPWDLYKHASMPYEWQPKLKQIAEDSGLIFFSSPFDLEAVDFLENMEVTLYKIASCEVNDIPLIRKVASTRKPVIISTGVASEADILLALDTCYKMDNHNVTLLKCTSEYPAKIEMANLSTIKDMRQRFKVPIGVSDHTMGSLVPIVAVALGAVIIEKHFTLNRKIEGVDSSFSMEPSEFKKMVDDVRLAEKSLGENSYNYHLAEKDRYRRRSLFVTKDIQKGEILTEKNVRSVRPGNGLEPKYYDFILGKTVKQTIAKGTPLQWELIADVDKY